MSATLKYTSFFKMTTFGIDISTMQTKVKYDEREMSFHHHLILFSFSTTNLETVQQS